MSQGVELKLVFTELFSQILIFDLN